MAESDETEPGTLRRVAKALMPAYFTVFLVLTGLWFAVTFFGDPMAGMASVKMEVGPLVPAAEHKPEPVKPPVKPTTPAAKGITEQTEQGILPRIADDGTLPMNAYAGEQPQGKGPRITLVVGGLGINEKATQNALSLLPSGVTLAFVPYAYGVDKMAAAARQKGHEVLIEIPMEPNNFPDNDAGPYTLRTGSDDVSNIQRLIWVLTRFTGYTGATALMGEKFLTDNSAVSPVLSFMARRGILFFSNRPSGSIPTEKAAAAAGIAFARADLVIDDNPSAADIDRKLAELEKIAKSKGRASGWARLYPVSVDRINTWAQALAGKGIELAPASAVVSAPKITTAAGK